MRKTGSATAAQKPNAQRLAVDTGELSAMLCCGRDTAVKIGSEAGARIKIGKRVLWNVAKVQAFLDEIAEG